MLYVFAFLQSYGKFQPNPIILVHILKKAFQCHKSYQFLFLPSECPQKIVQIHEDGKRVTCMVERSNYDGRIHWFHGTVNLTSQSTQDIYSAIDGSYTLISSLNDSSNWKTYNCSYWVPQIEQYITSNNIVMEHNTQSNTLSFSSDRWTGLIFCLCLLWMVIQQ